MTIQVVKRPVGGVAVTPTAPTKERIRGRMSRPTVLAEKRLREPELRAALAVEANHHERDLIPLEEDDPREWDLRLVGEAHPLVGEDHPLEGVSTPLLFAEISSRVGDPRTVLVVLRKDHSTQGIHPRRHRVLLRLAPPRPAVAPRPHKAQR